MKAIQVSIDEDLLSALDADEEVRREGRSAVLRRAAAEYLRRKRAEEISRRYRAGYVQGVSAADELRGWADQGTWPQDG
jgi:metal-responsive CopG/Arc/MetJ family transcriptional regulator